MGITLFFSKAFTFSMFSVPEHYKKHTEELKKKAQDIVKSKTMKDRTRKPSVVKEVKYYQKQLHRL